jgi:hypothetical protein
MMMVQEPKSLKQCFKESLLLFGIWDLIIILLTWFANKDSSDNEKTDKKI